MGKEDSVKDIFQHIQTHEQAHAKKEFYEMEETYVSKSGKDACMTSNLKTLHTFLICYGKILNESQQD
jgi:hypothetical protein